MKSKDTNRKQRTVIRNMLLLGIYLLFPASLWSHHRYASEEDSLLRQSTSSDPAAAISALSRLAMLHELMPEEAMYYKQQLEIAIRIDSIPVVYSALGGLSLYNYNKGNRDSLLYWGAQIDSLAKSRKEYPNALFDFLSYSCQDLLWSNNNEQAMNEALQLYSLASETKSTHGLIHCGECLGLVYRAIRRDSDAVVAFQEGLDLLNTIEGKLETQIRITSLQAGCAVRAQMSGQAEDALSRYETLIQKQEKQNTTAGEVYPVQRERWLLYSLYTYMYTNKHQMDSARFYLDKATLHDTYSHFEGDYAERLYLFIQAYYYKNAGDLPKALSVINQLLEMEQLAEDLTLKADLLKEMNQLPEALDLYDKVFHMKSDNSKESFFRQINQLRTLHDKHNRDVEAHQLEISNVEMAAKQYQLILSMIVALILFISLYILFIYLRRMRRLKNELMNEKRSLLQSQQKLADEKNKADKASEMKSLFVANMSHEIRTPLNAIVECSNLLTEKPASHEEKEEYTGIIKNNTKVLLKLLDDVLNLSRTEPPN